MHIYQHIRIKHKGNQSAFARSQGVDRHAVQRWIAADCIWINDQVWRKVGKHSK